MSFEFLCLYIYLLEVQEVCHFGWNGVCCSVGISCFLVALWVMLVFPNYHRKVFSGSWKPTGIISPEYVFIVLFLPHMLAHPL